MKLKTIIAGALIGGLSIGNIFADEARIPLEIDGNWSANYRKNNLTPKGWQVNGKLKDGTFTWVEVADGHAFEMKGNPDGEQPYAFYTSANFPVQEGGTIKGKVMFRGEGILKIQVYLYNEEGESIGSTEAMELTPKNTEDLTEQDFQINIEKKPKGIPALGRLAVVIPQTSTIQITHISASTE